jgi:hypothetical protein
MRLLPEPKPLYHLSGCNAPMLLTTVVYDAAEPMSPIHLRALDGSVLPRDVRAACPACAGDIQLGDLIAQLREAA